MLKKRNAKYSNGSNNWHDYYTTDALRLVGISPKLPFIYIGEGLEPIYAWNKQSHHYDGDIVGYRVWVVQNSNGYVQNPIPVRVDQTHIDNLDFGCQVKFKGLLGYYSRKSYSYSFRADEVINNETK